ncbi:MAG: hypothetical protein IJU51_06285 [Clostridia bacterium]|nr:hypothetical protein [Clostridia bacterium]
MKYCSKCKKIYTKSNPEICPACGRELISDPGSFSPVDIVTAHGFELERVCSALKEAGIPFSTREVRRDMGIQILNAAPPENCIVTVPLEQYQQAVELLIGIGAMQQAEELSDDDRQQIADDKAKNDEETSPTKGTFNKVVLIIMFIILVGITIAAADVIGRLINPSFYQ